MLGDQIGSIVAINLASETVEVLNLLFPELYSDYLTATTKKIGRRDRKKGSGYPKSAAAISKQNIHDKNRSAANYLNVG